MKPDDFEQRLSRQPLRPVPTEWRDAVLARAGDLQSLSPISQLSTFNPQPAPWWREWLWPCPQAWASLAAVWVLVLFFHANAPEVATPAPRVAMEATPQQFLALLRTGSLPHTEAPEIQQKPVALPPGTPRPRSERRTLVVAV